MRIRLSTVRFAGAGSLDCRRCSRRVTFPDGAWLVIFDYGAHQVVKSAHSGVTLHQCGRDFFWQCDDCGGEPDVTFVARHFRRGRSKQVLRCICGGEFKQHRLEVVGGSEEVPVPATPF